MSRFFSNAPPTPLGIRPFRKFQNDPKREILRFKFSPSYKFVRSATYLLNTGKGGEEKSAAAVEEDDVSRAALSQSQITSSKGPICPQSMLAIHHRPIANEASHIEGASLDGSVLLSVEKSSSFALVVFLWLIFTLMKDTNQH